MDSAYSRNEENERIFQILSRLKDEYNGLAFNNHTKQALLDLKVDDLPNDLRGSLELCAMLTQVLGLEDVNKHTLMIRNTEMLLKRHCDREKQFSIKLNAVRIGKILKDLENQTSVIKRMCERYLDDNENLMEHTKKKVASVAFLEEKLKCYNEQVEKINVTIAEVEPKFEFKEVIECDATIKSMDEEIGALRSKLDRYRNLPPNMILAVEKLKEEKLKLKRCEEELSNFIDNYVQRFK